MTTTHTHTALKYWAYPRICRNFVPAFLACSYTSSNGPHRTTCNSKMIHTLSPVHPCISSSICRYLCNSLYRSKIFFLSSCERVCAHFAVDSLTPPLFPHLRMSWKSKTYQDPTWLKRNYCCAACLLTISPTFNKNWYLSFSQRHFFAGCPPTTNSSTQLITKIEPKPL